MGKELFIYKDSFSNYITITEKQKLQLEIGQYIIDNPSYSIKQVASEYELSSKTIRKYLNDLQYIDDDLYLQCKNILKRRN